MPYYLWLPLGAALTVCVLEYSLNGLIYRPLLHSATYIFHLQLPHSIMGEELAFIFGAPLAPAGPFPSGNYTVQEKLLSEAVMAYWTNFVKTG